MVWFLCNGVSTVLFSAVLAAFATAVGAGPDKLVVLVLDNAGWHSSEQLVVPDGLRLAFLPPYSPELQPAERLWPLTNEAVANQSFATLQTWTRPWGSVAARWPACRSSSRGTPTTAGGRNRPRSPPP